MNNTLYQEDKEEVTLKGLILIMKDMMHFLMRKWIIIGLVAAAGAGLGLYYANKQQIQYLGELKFVLEESKAGGLSGYAGLANQFGIDIGGGRSGLFSGDNILGFLTSRLMIERALLTPLRKKDSVISLAEYYINFKGIRTGWENNPKLRNFRLPPNVDRSTFSRDQDSILYSLYQQIDNSHLKVAKEDKKFSFISVICKSEDELFSKLFVEELVKQATDFYVKTKTKRSQANVDILQSKADSISSLLNRKTYSAAVSHDLNLNPARRVAMVNTELMQMDKTVLQTMYSEVLRNLEMSKFAMAQETPLIQIIDMPIMPLQKEKLGRVKGMLIGGFLGAFLITFILILIRIYNQIMIG